VLCSNKTVTGINDAFIGHRDQSAKNHFLTAAQWSLDDIEQSRFALILDRVQRDHIQDGCLIIDDSISHKTGKHIDGVDWHYDHSEGKTVLGHQLVTTHYCCRSFHVPLYVEQYQRDSGFTKNQIARNMIDRAATSGLPFSVVAMDSWYFTQDNTRHIEQRGKQWVAACKSNRLIDWCGRKVRLDEWVRTIAPDEFRPITLKDGSRYWAYYKTVTMVNQGRVRIVASHQEENLSDEVHFFAASGKDWPAIKILNVYQRRWTIETFYRDAKQNLGLEDCELRIAHGIKRHYALVFLAYTLLQLSSLQRSLCRWLSANLKTIGGKCQLAAVELLRSFILFVVKATQQEQSVDEVVELCFKSSAQIRFTFA
jgi:SRSO17 transposase